VSDVFEEVNEAIARDRAASLWKKAAPFVIGGAAAVVLAVGGWELYQYQRTNEIEAAAGRFAAAAGKIEQGDTAAGVEALAEVGSGTGAEAGFAALALNLLAGAETAPGADRAKAADHLEAASALNTGPLSSIALLKLAYVRSDQLARAELETLVKPLVEEGGPMASLARELLALKSLAEGDVETARSELQALTLDLEAPQAMLQRVNQALEVMPRAPSAGTSPDASGGTSPEQGGQ